MTVIRTERLILRNWEERDRELFHRINSEPAVMEFFPFRRDRAQADAKMDQISAEIAAQGYGWTAVEIAATGQCIGFFGLHDVEIEPVAPAGSIEIGWRLAPEFWGHGYVTEAATALLDFGFDKLGKPEVVSFAVTNNKRSRAVMERLGMRRDPLLDFDHPEIPDTQPHLKRHVFYRVTREDWEARKRAAN
ncbi:RimJ/RimL family protein N-acetyltransferase [Mesorhizobium soli]|uniref:GNAT family N-acetyltransferase n=1 Tax=Pseudaminobacter soli (ex Li et al. 2025) TaxID=1295366 RepID=UPI002475A1A2|nr:GNAT family N-acetyltransferase [Mesorhizobium soli]MDH6232525.1 RimJ/RimL family protein N-acetyltransferase [Mesorhizobium soli]